MCVWSWTKLLNSLKIALPTDYKAAYSNLKISNEELASAKEDEVFKDFLEDMIGC
jgi:hypothetical protein